MQNFGGAIYSLWPFQSVIKVVHCMYFKVKCDVIFGECCRILPCFPLVGCAYDVDSLRMVVGMRSM